ncbi:MAG: sulfotransferase [Gammaproteobacteria bacterium]|nr:sulfotransferase [Gammaproteobacteria bacterium]
MKQLIYIASTGYSGTTLLDMLLNNHPEVSALGEVYLLSRYAKENSNCTCGEAVNDCVFWRKVESNLKEFLHDQTLSLASFPLTVEGKIQSLNRKIPKFNDILLLIGSKWLWKMFAGLTPISSECRQAAKNAVNLFNVVSDAENTPVIVDSSKYALPLKALYLTSPCPVKIIYMIRDGRAVCRSLVMRKDNWTYERAVHHWVRYNWNLKLIMRTVDKNKIKLVKYEDLCQNTENELNSIFKFIDIDPSTNTLLNKGGYHNIGGNPMRFRKEENEIRIDEKWKDEITDEEAEIFEKYAGKMNRSFGYQ